MPKKRAAIENGRTANKKSRLDLQVADTDSDGNDEPQEGASSGGAVKRKRPSLKDILLRQMEAAADGKVKYADFDFDQIKIDGFTTEQLRAQYGSLRASAFRRIKRLNLKEEIGIVDEYGLYRRLETGKPKRPPSAYLRFCWDEKPKILKKHPELGKNLKNVIPLLAEKWRNLSPEKKRRYQDQYEVERSEFFQMHPDQATKKEKKNGPSQKSTRAAPKAKSAFDLFCDAKRDEYAKKYDLKGPVLMAKMAEKFAKLSDKKRDKWERKAREAMDSYLQGLVQKERSQAEERVDDAAGNHQRSRKSGKAEAVSYEATSTVTKSKNNDYMDFLVGGDANAATSSSPESTKGKKRKKEKSMDDRNDWLF